MLVMSVTVYPVLAVETVRSSVLEDFHLEKVMISEVGHPPDIPTLLYNDTHTSFAITDPLAIRESVTEESAASMLSVLGASCGVEGSATGLPLSQSLDSLEPQVKNLTRHGYNLRAYYWVEISNWPTSVALQIPSS